MYCKNCGKNIPDDANVCPYCTTQQVSAPNPDLQARFGGNQNGGEAVMTDNVLQPPARRAKKGFGIAAWVLTGLYVMYAVLSLVYFYSMADADVGEKIFLVIFMFPLTLAATPIGAAFMSLFNVMYIVFAIVQLCRWKRGSKGFCIATGIAITVINLAGIAYNIVAVGLLQGLTESTESAMAILSALV